MATRESRLIAFVNIGAQWAPCGQLVLTEEGSNLIASSFAYGLNYLKRNDALEVDPVSLSIAERTAISGKYLLPVSLNQRRNDKEANRSGLPLKMLATARKARSIFRLACAQLTSCSSPRLQ